MSELASDLMALLGGLADAGVEFIVVGGAAATLGGASIVTFDLDVVHRRTPDNVDRLLVWLLAHGAYHRLDLANRRLPPTRDVLFGSGHLNLQTDLGKLDVLCELAPSEGYDELLSSSTTLTLGASHVYVLTLAKVIDAKRRAGRPKDKAVLPILLATLDEQRKSGV